MAEEQKKKPKLIHNVEITVNLTNLAFTVKSSRDNLKTVFSVADTIARNLGRVVGLDGKIDEDRFRKAGIQ